VLGVQTSKRERLDLASSIATVASVEKENNVPSVRSLKQLRMGTQLVGCLTMVSCRECADNSQDGLPSCISVRCAPEPLERHALALALLACAGHGRRHRSRSHQSAPVRRST
jgi:hypothetical protein